MCARPKKWRYCSSEIKRLFFKPQGIQLPFEIADLKGDELEAMRLCDLKELDHEDAAREVGISRRTLERLLNSGRNKVAEALIVGRGIKISFPEYLAFRKNRR